MVLAPHGWKTTRRSGLDFSTTGSAELRALHVEFIVNFLSRFLAVCWKKITVYLHIVYGRYSRAAKLAVTHTESPVNKQVQTSFSSQGGDFTVGAHQKEAASQLRLPEVCVLDSFKCVKICLERPIASHGSLHGPYTVPQKAAITAWVELLSRVLVKGLTCSGMDSTVP